MFKKTIYPLFLLALAYLITSHEDAKVIIAGVAIFMIGMFFMEDGFRSFSGGLLQSALARSTSTVPKAIGVGFVATAIVQSSSLLSVIIISFLSAHLISLSGAIGVIFGSNLGTTATAWIVSAFGVKLKIASYAMPMIIFGVVMRFTKSKNYQGLGNILLGLGFVFLGISYMKDGFASMQDTFDLASFALDGYLGILVYISVGAFMTIVIQSSSAAMALIITALATGQIEYFNALSLAIGSNIGTTVTAILGSLGSNENGKRLAVAHLIFNLITALIAISFIYTISDTVQFLAGILGIASDDYAMQLALFHTIFNLLGIICVAPFTRYLVKFLETLFVVKSQEDTVRYLDDVVITTPEAALSAVKKEVQHLYDNTIEIISHAISLHRHEIFNTKDVCSIVEHSTTKFHTNIDDYYEKNIKGLYGEILHYSTLAQEQMDEEQKTDIYELKSACLRLVEAVKNVRELEKNSSVYLKSNNEFIKEEYNALRSELAKTMSTIEQLRSAEDDLEVIASLDILTEERQHAKESKHAKIDELIRNDQIKTKMATSLINDRDYTYNIIKNLIKTATTLLTRDSDLRVLKE